MDSIRIPDESQVKVPQNHHHYTEEIAFEIYGNIVESHYQKEDAMMKANYSLAYLIRAGVNILAEFKHYKLLVLNNNRVYQN